MARIRTIKPEFPQSESMGRVSREARLFFLLIWTVADDAGRLRGNSRLLASLLYPFDLDVIDLIETWINELENEECIVRYVHSGTTYIQIHNWLKHQKIDKPTESRLPEFSESLRIVAKPREDSTTDLGSGSGSGSGSRTLDLGPGPQEVPSAPARATPAIDSVKNVFEHWKTVHNHPQSVLSAARRKLIQDRLKEFSESDLCQSITGYLNSPHHMGQNDRDTVYNDIGLFMRDSKHVEAGLQFYRQPPRKGLSAKTRQNVDAIADWVPPEARRAAS